MGDAALVAPSRGQQALLVATPFIKNGFGVASKPWTRLSVRIGKQGLAHVMRLDAASDESFGRADLGLKLKHGTALRVFPSRRLLTQVGTGDRFRRGMAVRAQPRHDAIAAHPETAG